MRGGGEIEEKHVLVCLCEASQVRQWRLLCPLRRRRQLRLRVLRALGIRQRMQLRPRPMLAPRK
jgi:hypothetical protein